MIFPSFSDFFADLPELKVKLALIQNLNEEQQKTFTKHFKGDVIQFMENNTISPNGGLYDFIYCVVQAYNLRITTLGFGCLEITVQCPTLDSLESLWEDYRSGHLREVAERCLVTSEIKRKLGLETVTLTTTIKEDDYLACKKSLLENSVTGKSCFKKLIE